MENVIAVRVPQPVNEELGRRKKTMRYNAETLPMVAPMMVRKITTKHWVDMFGGVLVLDEYDVEDVGVADKRNEWDDDVVDCSNRIFEITTAMMGLKDRRNFTAFPSRRWRNCRNGLETFDETKTQAMYEGKLPLLYIGNPVRLFTDPQEGITVVRIPEFLIRSGVQLGY